MGLDEKGTGSKRPDSNKCGGQACGTVRTGKEDKKPTPAYTPETEIRNWGTWHKSKKVALAECSLKALKAQLSEMSFTNRVDARRQQAEEVKLVVNTCAE